MYITGTIGEDRNIGGKLETFIDGAQEIAQM
jgi:hypothetical protein